MKTFCSTVLSELKDQCVLFSIHIDLRNGKLAAKLIKTL